MIKDPWTDIGTHPRLPLQSDNQNLKIANSWKIEDIIGSWSKLGMKLSFTSCPKIPMTKKVLGLRPHLSCFPTHESIVYLRKGFIKYLLKYVKQFLWDGFYQELRGVLSPWLLSTVTRLCFNIHLNHSQCHCTVKVVKGIAIWLKKCFSYRAVKVKKFSWQL